MRIAFFSTMVNSPWGGSEVLWSNTAKYLVQQGHTVAAFIKQWNHEAGHVTDLKKNGVEIYYYSSQTKGRTFLSKIYRKISPLIFGEQMVFDSLFKWNPEFIIFSQGHSFDMGYYSTQQLQPLLSTKIPFAMICLNNSDYNFIPPNEVRAKIKTLYEKANKVFFVSKRNRLSAEMILCKTLKNAEIVSTSMSWPSTKVEVIPFPENTEIQFASVARLRCSHKGQNVLLHILRQKKWLNRSWKFNIYGNGEDEDYLKELSIFFNLTERVIFHGQISNTQNVWHNNHILLLASFGEGMPVALQEAMLCGRPALVTDMGGNAELITEGETGWLAEGTTFTAIDNALERAWADKDSWKKIGEQAHQKIKDIIDLTPEMTLSNYIISVGN